MHLLVPEGTPWPIHAGKSLSGSSLNSLDWDSYSPGFLFDFHVRSVPQLMEPVLVHSTDSNCTNNSASQTSTCYYSCVEYGCKEWGSGDPELRESYDESDQGTVYESVQSTVYNSIYGSRSLTDFCPVNTNKTRKNLIGKQILSAVRATQRRKWHGRLGSGYIDFEDIDFLRTLEYWKNASRDVTPPLFDNRITKVAEWKDDCQTNRKPTSGGEQVGDGYATTRKCTPSEKPKEREQCDCRNKWIADEPTKRATCRTSKTQDSKGENSQREPTNATYKQKLYKGFVPTVSEVAKIPAVSPRQSFLNWLDTVDDISSDVDDLANLPKENSSNTSCCSGCCVQLPDQLTERSALLRPRFHISSSSGTPALNGVSQDITTLGAFQKVQHEKSIDAGKPSTAHCEGAIHQLSQTASEILIRPDPCNDCNDFEGDYTYQVLTRSRSLCNATTSTRLHDSRSEDEVYCDVTSIDTSNSFDNVRQEHVVANAGEIYLQSEGRQVNQAVEQIGGSISCCSHVNDGVAPVARPSDKADRVQKTNTTKGDIEQRRIARYLPNIHTKQQSECTDCEAFAGGFLQGIVAEAKREAEAERRATSTVESGVLHEDHDAPGIIRSGDDVKIDRNSTTETASIRHSKSVDHKSLQGVYSNPDKNCLYAGPDAKKYRSNVDQTILSPIAAGIASLVIVQAERELRRELGERLGDTRIRSFTTARTDTNDKMNKSAQLAKNYTEDKQGRDRKHLSCEPAEITTTLSDSRANTQINDAHTIKSISEEAGGMVRAMMNRSKELLERGFRANTDDITKYPANNAYILQGLDDSDKDASPAGESRSEGGAKSDTCTGLRGYLSRLTSYILQRSTEEESYLASATAATHSEIKVTRSEGGLKSRKVLVNNEEGSHAVGNQKSGLVANESFSSVSESNSSGSCSLDSFHSSRSHAAVDDNRKEESRYLRATGFHEDMSLNTGTKSAADTPEFADRMSRELLRSVVHENIGDRRNLKHDELALNTGSFLAENTSIEELSGCNDMNKHKIIERYACSLANDIIESAKYPDAIADDASVSNESSPGSDYGVKESSSAGLGEDLLHRKKRCVSARLHRSLDTTKKGIARYGDSQIQSEDKMKSSSREISHEKDPMCSISSAASADPAGTNPMMISSDPEIDPCQLIGSCSSCSFSVKSRSSSLSSLDSQLKDEIRVVVETFEDDRSPTGQNDQDYYTIVASWSSFDIDREPDSALQHPLATPTQDSVRIGPLTSSHSGLSSSNHSSFSCPASSTEENAKEEITVLAESLLQRKNPTSDEKVQPVVLKTSYIEDDTPSVVSPDLKTCEEANTLSGTTSVPIISQGEDTTGTLCRGSPVSRTSQADTDTLGGEATAIKIGHEMDGLSREASSSKTNRLGDGRDVQPAKCNSGKDHPLNTQLLRRRVSYDNNTLGEESLVRQSCYDDNTQTNKSHSLLCNSKYTARDTIYGDHSNQETHDQELCNRENIESIAPSDSKHDEGSSNKIHSHQPIWSNSDWSLLSDSYEAGGSDSGSSLDEQIKDEIRLVAEVLAKERCLCDNNVLAILSTTSSNCSLIRDSDQPPAENRNAVEITSSVQQNLKEHEQGTFKLAVNLLVNDDGTADCSVDISAQMEDSDAKSEVSHDLCYNKGLQRVSCSAPKLMPANANVEHNTTMMQTSSSETYPSLSLIKSRQSLDLKNFDSERSSSIDVSDNEANRKMQALDETSESASTCNPATTSKRESNEIPSKYSVPPEQNARQMLLAPKESDHEKAETSLSLETRKIEVKGLPESTTTRSSTAAKDVAQKPPIASRTSLGKSAQSSSKSAPTSITGAGPNVSKPCPRSLKTALSKPLISRPISERTVLPRTLKTRPIIVEKALVGASKTRPTGVKKAATSSRPKSPEKKEDITKEVQCAEVSLEKSREGTRAASQEGQTGYNNTFRAARAGVAKFATQGNRKFVSGTGRIGQNSEIKTGMTFREARAEMAHFATRNKGGPGKVKDGTEIKKLGAKMTTPRKADETARFRVRDIPSVRKPSQDKLSPGTDGIPLGKTTTTKTANAIDRPRLRNIPFVKKPSQGDILGVGKGSCGRPGTGGIGFGAKTTTKTSNAIDRPRLRNIPFVKKPSQGDILEVPSGKGPRGRPGTEGIGMGAKTTTKTAAIDRPRLCNIPFVKKPVQKAMF